MPTENKIFYFTLALSIALLIAAITQKSYVLDNGQPPGDGSAAFFFGWLGVFYGGAGLCWLANPAVIASWVLMKSNPGMALGFSALATVLALAFLWFDKIVANEGGGVAAIIGYKLGYWLWVSSMAATLGGNGLIYYLIRTKQ